MKDETLLARVLALPAHEPAESAIDEIMHLAQSTKYEAAADRAAELLEAGSKDVRAVIVYALGVFAERGPGSIPSLFQAITRVLATRVSPVSTRATDTALRFGFRAIKAHLEFDERKTGDARNPWSKYFGATSPALVLRACSDLRAAIHEAIETPRCEGELASVTARLEAYCGRFSPERRLERVLSVEPPAEPRVSQEPPPSAELELPEPLPAPLAPSLPSEFSRRESDHASSESTLPISPALRQFMRKLAAFEQLVLGGNLAKAAVVAHDIRQVVADFDPVTYLPELLSPHFRLLTRNVEQLSPYWEENTTPGWQTLEQLYRVDLAAFIEA